MYSEQFPHLAASIRDLTLSIRREGASAYASHDYSAGKLTLSVFPSAHESISANQWWQARHE